MSVTFWLLNQSLKSSLYPKIILRFKGFIANNITMISLKIVFNKTIARREMRERGNERQEEERGKKKKEKREKRETKYKTTKFKSLLQILNNKNIKRLKKNKKKYISFLFIFFFYNLPSSVFLLYKCLP